MAINIRNTGAGKSAKMLTPPLKHRSGLICVVLVLMTLAAFWSVLRCDFVRYDDDRYVTENAYIKGGLTAESAIQAFTKPHYFMWHPLTTLSYLLDYELFALNPAWYHLVNLAFHLANVLLLFGVLGKLTGAVWPSAFVAAVFAVHPLQADSVAWIAERKNVLSGFFWLLTMAAYARYADRPGIGGYLLVFACLCLGLMAKPTVVVLPFVLLLLDYWPLDRLQWPGKNGPSDPRRSKSKQIRPKYAPALLLAEKVPMLIAAAAVSIATVVTTRAGGVLPELASVPLSSRLANALISYFTYIEKLIWPSGLAVFYPHPGANFSAPRLIVSIIALVLISTCCLYFGRRRKYLIVGWLWYLGTLVPVIGLIQAGAQARANRYMYLTMVGLLVIIAWTAGDILAKRGIRPLLPAAAAAVMLSAAVVCASVQVGHWRNGLALFKRAVEVTDNNYIMHNNYANRLKDAGEIDLAIEHYTKCLFLKPDSAEAHNNLGNALADIGRPKEAIANYERAIQLAQQDTSGQYPPPGLAEAHHNLANALRGQRQFPQACEHYNAALKFKPDNLDTLGALALTFDAMQKYDDVVGCYSRMLEIDPDHIIAHGRLGMALAKKGNLDKAIDEFRFVLSRRPDDVEMHCNLGILLEQQNKTDEAIKEYRWALEINRNDPKAKQLFQAAMEKQKKP